MSPITKFDDVVQVDDDSIELHVSVHGGSMAPIRDQFVDHPAGTRPTLTLVANADGGVTISWNACFVPIHQPRAERRTLS